MLYIYFAYYIYYISLYYISYIKYIIKMIYYMGVQTLEPVFINDNYHPCANNFLSLDCPSNDRTPSF